MTDVQKDRLALVLTVIAFFLVLALIAPTSGQEPERHDKYRDDPKAYCLPEHEKPRDDHGHQCACKLVCTGADQAPAEDTTCQMFCSHARCACHPEESCEPRGL